MRSGTIALAVLLVVVAFLYVRSRVRRARDLRLPPGVTMPSSLRHTVSEAHFDACVQALRSFATEFRLSFQHGGCTRARLLSMHALRDEALRHMHQMRMRMPNDLGAETVFAQHIDDTDALLRSHLEDMQRRCGESLTYPGPIDDVFYRRFWRAHNDETR